MKSQILIEELQPSAAALIQESSGDGKNTWLSGVFMQAEIKNRNGRNYPLNEIANAVKSATARIAESNGIFGELDHPQTLTINMDRVSHVITELNMSGTNAMGRAKLLDTPMGLIAQELVKSGVRCGVSSRGAGAVNESGGVSGFNFVTADIVAQPSAPGALPDPIYESLMASIHGKETVHLAQQLREDPAAQEYFKKEIRKFLSEGLFAKR